VPVGTRGRSLSGGPSTPRVIPTRKPAAVYKEEFSLAYVHSVAAAAGVGITISLRPDIDGVDVAFAGFVGRRARLEAQVKSFTYQPEPEQPTIPYDLKVENHRLLTLKTHTPRILIVVTVPANVADWCAHTEEGFRLHRCGYYFNLQGLPETKRKKTERVQIPRTNLFCPAALTDVLTRIEEGNWP